ncbi:MAG: polysaccharide deacetylase family protein [Patescibacteria group bacterium]
MTFWRRDNRYILPAVLLIMSLFIIGSFFLFAKPDHEIQSAPSSAVLDIATIAEPTEIILPEQVQVPILVYHHIRPTPAGLSAADQPYSITAQAFEAQLSYLRDHGFTGVLLTDIRDALLEGKKLPDKPVAITFDDGRDNQYTAAFPLLEQYGFVATFSPFTNAIGRPNYLTWEQLSEMQTAGHGIGSHAVYHPYMTKLTVDEMRREALDSRLVLKEKLGSEIAVFAHPFGLFDEQVNAVLADVGYSVARGLEHRDLHTAEDLLSLGSYIVTENFKYFTSIVGE